MTTPAEYNAAIAAALKIIRADINQDVPYFFRSEIPESDIQQFATDTARMAVDAAAAVRAKAAAIAQTTAPAPIPPTPPTSPKQT